MARRVPDADFHLVGGNPEDVDFWQKQLAGRHPNVFLHGFVPPPVAEAMRAWADVLVAPYQEKVSVHGGGGNTVEWMSPLKIFFFLAAGKAILSSDLPVLHEVLRPGENALLCPPADVTAWVSALLRLRDNADLRQSLGAKAQEDFLSHYTWEARAKTILLATNEKP